MKPTPFVIGALVLIALVRLVRRRRGSRPRRAMVVLPARLRDRKLLGDTGLVAGREIRERLRGRLFRVATIILFAVVAAAVVIPTIHTTTTKRQETVGVVAGSPSLSAELKGLADNVGLSVTLVNEPDLTHARAELSSGRLAVVIDGTEKIVVNNPLSASDTSAGARYVRSVSEILGAERAFARAGLTPKQAATVARAKPLAVDSIHPGKNARTTAEATALLGVILVFIVLNQYLTWTLMGVMEEKASRVVEVLLATVRPIQLLAGKVIGIGAVALAQAVALVVFALVLGQAVGSSLVHGAAPLVAVATLIWLVLGYSFYSWLYAAAGSLAERQDQVQSLALPLSAPLIFGYIVSLASTGSDHASLLLKVLAYLPPTAPFAMPTLVGFGEATWWQFLLSVVITLVCIAGVALAAARVYRTAVLRTGHRVRLRELVPTLTR